MRLVECTSCTFRWRSRTSANAVDAYHAVREEKIAKQEREKEKIKAKPKRKKKEA
jgi:hypothetical protein